MPTLPSQLKIGGHIFAVELKDLTPEDVLGSTDFVAGAIFIESTLIPSVKWSTLLHEAFHVINPTMDSTPDGHRLLESLSEQLYQFGSDNKICFNSDHDHYQPETPSSDSSTTQ